MNRHVSKRVCLGLQFQVSFAEDVADAPALPDRSSSVSVYNEDALSSDPIDVEVPRVIEETSLDRFEEAPMVKSGKVPCPYCNKLFKGERGVRKHIQFYGCPMARLKI